jgi:hypothetical protein
MLLCHLQEPESRPVGLSLSLLPCPDRLRTDVQGGGEDGLGEGHVPPDSPDPIRRIPGGRLNGGFSGGVLSAPGGLRLASLDPNRLPGGLHEPLAESGLLPGLHCESPSRAFASFLSSFSSA